MSSHFGSRISGLDYATFGDENWIAFTTKSKGLNCFSCWLDVSFIEKVVLRTVVIYMTYFVLKRGAWQGGLFPRMLYFYLKIISSQVKSSHHFRPIYRQESCVLAAAKAGLSLISLGTAWIQGILITVVLRKKVCLDPRPISRCLWKDFIMIPPPAPPHFKHPWFISYPINQPYPFPPPPPPIKVFIVHQLLLSINNIVLFLSTYSFSKVY